VEGEKQQARERTAGDQQELDQLQTERKSIATQISPAVLSAYERVRKLRHGIALAEAVDGRCSQCHMSLRLQFFQDLKRGEQVMHCESCNRILYYNPPESFEHLTGEAAPAARG
jgi:predicted  nucleic acid-binding Zn-ribbon protein